MDLFERVSTCYDIVVEAAELARALEPANQNRSSLEMLAEAEGSMARYQEWFCRRTTGVATIPMEEHQRYLQGVGPLRAFDRAMQEFGLAIAGSRPGTTDLTLEDSVAPLLARLELPLPQFRQLGVERFWPLVLRAYTASVVAPPAAAPSMACKDCGGKLVPQPNSPTSTCEFCGLLTREYGEREDPSKPKGGRSKHFNPDTHCIKHLAWMMGEEEYEPPTGDTVVDQLCEIALRAYHRNGRQRSMENMRCEEVREWLKRIRRTELNVHAPKLRQLITARAGTPVVPPSLSDMEREDVLADFSIMAELFGEVTKDHDLLQKLNKEKVKNHPFYPYILYHVLLHHIPDRGRMTRFVDCIHFQSSTTLIKNDHILQRIVERMEGYTYTPTRPSDWR